MAIEQKATRVARSKSQKAISAQSRNLSSCQQASTSSSLTKAWATWWKSLRRMIWMLSKTTSSAHPKAKQDTPSTSGSRILIFHQEKSSTTRMRTAKLAITCSLKATQLSMSTRYNSIKASPQISQASVWKTLKEKAFTYSEENTQ